jgi:PAS domain S-box-containing protein
MLDTLKQLFQPPVFPDNDDLTREAITLDALLLFHQATVFIFGGLLVLSGSPPAAALAFSLVCLAGLGGLRYFLRRRVQAALWVYIGLLFAVITLVVVLQGGLTSPLLVCYLSGVIVVTILMGLRIGAGYTALTTLTMFIIGVAGGRGYLPPASAGTPAGDFFITTAVMLYTLIPVGITFRSLRQALMYARQQLDERQKAEAALRQTLAEQQTSEAALHQSETRLRAIISNLPVILFTLDAAGNYTLSEGKGLELLGLKPGEVVGQSALEMYQHQPQIMEKLRTALTGTQTRDVYDTQDFVFDVCYTPIFDADGKLTSLIAVAMNITEQRRAEAALRLSEERYRSLAELASDFAYSYAVNPDKSYVLEWITEEPFYRMMGARPDELQKDFSMYHPDDLPLAQQDVEAVVDGKQTSRAYRSMTKSGEMRWINIARYPVWDEQEQRVIRFYGVAQDVTARKEAEIALRQSEERYRLLAELASDYAYSFLVHPDKSYTLEWLTEESYARMTGANPAEFQTSFMLYHSDDQPLVKQDLEDLLNGKQTSLEYQIYTHTGEMRWFHIARYPVWDEQEQRVVRFHGVAQDVTARKEAEIALRLSEERYRLLAELVSDFAYSYSVNPDKTYDLEWITEEPYHRMTGADSAVVKDKFTLYHPDDVALVKQDMDEMLNGKQTRREYRIYTTSGELRWLNVVRNPVWDEQQQRVVRFYGAAQDVTARKEIEIALRQSEERYRLLAELASDYAYSYIVQPDKTCILEWITEEPFFRITGMHSGEVNNTNGLYHPDETPLLQHDLAMMLNGKQNTREYRIITRSGELRWLNIARYPVWDEGEQRVVRFYGVAQDVTARKEAEMALRQSEETARRFQEQLKILHEISLELSRTRTLDDLYYAAIEAGCSRLGFDRLGLFVLSESRTALCGTYGVDAEGDIRNIYDVALPVTAESMIMQAQRERKQVVFFEDRPLRDRDAVVGHGWSATAVLWDADKSIGCLFADNLRRQEPVSPMQIELLVIYSSMLGNLMTQRRTQEALQRSEERLKLALDSANDGLWDWNMETGEGYYSPRYYTIRGYENNAFTPSYEQWRDSVHPDDVERVDNREFDRFNNEYRMKTINGDYIWIIDRGQVVRRDAQGNALRVIGTISDISERKRAEVDLRESEEKFRAVFELAPSASLIVRLDGVIMDANQTALGQTGRSLGEIVNHTVMELDIVPGEPGFRVMVELLENGIQVEDIETGLVRSDGQRLTILASARYVSLGGEKHILMTWVDITRLKHAEAEILTLNAELEHRVIERTARLEATNRELEAFAYSVSHDLRSPLRSLDGFSQALLEDYGAVLDTIAHDYLHRIRAASQHMGEMIDALLSLSRITRTELRRQNVNLSEMAQAIIDSLREAEPGRQVTAAIAPDIVVEGDEQLLRIALQNLLQNAWKYTGRTANARIGFGTRLQDGQRVFYVTDNGAGFDMMYADRLFGAFQRLHTAHDFPGTGIGLATVQRIILRHGGRVSAQGQPGHGATFSFTLDTVAENLPAHNLRS